MVSLERYAELRAAIERDGDRDAVLRANKIPPAEWIQIQRRWLDALAEEIDAGGGVLAAQYCSAFEAAGPAPADAAAPVADAEEQAKANEPPADLPVAPIEPPVQQVPSFMKAPVLDAPPRKKPSTLLGAEAPRAPILPFNEGAQSDLSTPSPKDPEPKRGISTGTALTLDVPRAAATPFQGDPAPAPAAAAAPNPLAQTAPAQVVAAAPNPLARTAPAQALPAGLGQIALGQAALGQGALGQPAPAQAAPATPFQALEPEAMGFNLVKYAELVAARGERGAVLADVLAELGIDAAIHDRIEAYWRRKFSENGMLSLQFGTHLGNAKKALAERRGPRPAHAGSGTAIVMDPPKAATPFAAPAAQAAAAGASSALPDLTVEQYAWLAATLRRTQPDQMEAALSRLRLTPQTRKELEERWSKRMSDHPGLRQTFLAALARHLAGGAA